MHRNSMLSKWIMSMCLQLFLLRRYVIEFSIVWRLLFQKQKKTESERRKWKTFSCDFRLSENHLSTLCSVMTFEMFVRVVKHMFSLCNWLLVFWMSGTKKKWWKTSVILNLSTHAIPTNREIFPFILHLGPGVLAFMICYYYYLLFSKNETQTNQSN